MYEENRPDQGAPIAEEAFGQAPLSSEATGEEATQEATAVASGTAGQASADPIPEELSSEQEQSPDVSSLPADADEAEIACQAAEGAASEKMADPACDEDEATPTCQPDAESASQAFASSDPSLEAPAHAPAASGGETLASAPDLERTSQGELNRLSAEANKEQVLALQAELALLQRQIQQKKEAMERMQREVLEFSELYPDHALSELPDDVWESVRHGVPIAAAFALSERRRERTLQKATESNQENRLRSPGSLGHTRADFFTAEEVRAMSPAEVHRHYSTILRSMKSWT